MPRYSYDLQYADSEGENVIEKGVAPPADILAAFDAFDWAGQVGLANRLQKCAPTFTIHDLDAGRLLWVSAGGEPQAFTFVNEYSYPGEVRSAFQCSE